MIYSGMISTLTIRFVEFTLAKEQRARVMTRSRCLSNFLFVLIITFVCNINRCGVLGFVSVARNEKRIDSLTTSTSQLIITQRHYTTPSQCLSSTRLYNFFNFGNDGNEKKRIENEKKVAAEKNIEKSKEDKDPVEKIFNFFFGEPEAEPLGLKRFGKERFPEQYPATIDEFADPVPGDKDDVALIRPVLKNTNFEFRPLRLAYDANRDGWSTKSFRSKVEKQGAGLVVATTTSGLVCGGYNPKGWVGYGEARGSIAAFLFRIDGISKSVDPNKSSTTTSKRYTKLRKVGGASLAQIDNPDGGIMFGADSLIIPLSNTDNNPRVARSKLGSYYERFPDGTNTLFGKELGPTVQLKDLKVYLGVYEPGEYIPFTDAEPFALY